MIATKRQLETAAEAARQSPNVFAYLTLGFEQSPIHKRLQRHLSQHDDCYIELHRGLGKTSQLSLRVAWEIGRNPDIRVKYVQNKKDQNGAVATVRAIRHILESDAYKIVFPNIEHDKEQWGAEAFRVKTAKWSRDSTVQAEGINGRAGGRFDLIVADDVCDLQNAIQKPAERDKVKEAWTTNWLPMADYSRGTPRRWKIGTPYHVSDITADWRAQHEQDGSLMREPVRDFQSPWSVFTPDILRAERARMGPIAYGRAYELVPISSAQLIFAAEWIDNAMYGPGEHETAPWRNGRNIAAMDFAFSEKTSNNDNPDYSVLLIGRRGSNGHVYILDMIRVQTTFPEFIRMADAKCASYGVSFVYGEGNGPQKGLIQTANQMMSVPVRGINRDRDKMVRAADCQAFVETGRLRLPMDETGGVRRDLKPLYDEMTTFPAGEHDDTVDACMDLMSNAESMSPMPEPTRFFNPAKQRDRVFA